MKKILGLVILVVFVVLAVATKDDDSSPKKDKQEQTVSPSDENQTQSSDSIKEMHKSEEDLSFENSGDDQAQVDESEDFTNEEE